MFNGVFLTLALRKVRDLVLEKQERQNDRVGSSVGNMMWTGQDMLDVANYSHDPENEDTTDDIDEHGRPSLCVSQLNMQVQPGPAGLALGLIEVR